MIGIHGVLVCPDDAVSVLTGSKAVNGNFVDNGGDRGNNICYFDHCFVPVSADDNTVEFKAVVTYCHSDNPYELGFDDDFHYVMKNTENGWRVDRFDVLYIDGPKELWSQIKVSAFFL